jgi:PAS domain S-box-containing protein
MLHTGVFDIVAVDQSIPAQPGMEVVRSLASEGPTPPIVMVATAGDEKAVAEAMKLGASEYVVRDPGGGYLDLLPTVMEQVLIKCRLEEGKRLAEKARAESERRFRSLVEAAKDVIWTLDLNLKYSYISPSVTGVLGYTPEELSRLDPLDTVTPDSREKIWNAFVEEMQREQNQVGETYASRTIEIEQYRKDGSICCFEITTTFLRDDKGFPTGVLGISRDINERKRAMEALRQGEARYRRLVDNSPVGIVSCDSEGKLTELNPAALTILGVLSEDAIEDSGVRSFQPLVDARISASIVKCIETGELVLGEFPYKKPNGEQIYTRLRAAPIREEDGPIKGALAVLEDISDQKKAEGSRMRSQRLKAVVEMAGGVARNFSNSLRMVAAEARMALSCMESRDYSEVRTLLEQISESAGQAMRTMRRIQQFARLGPPMGDSPADSFDLSDAVQEAIEKRELWWDPELESQGIKISFEAILTKGCHVAAEQEELVEVAANLLKNAVEALPSGGAVNVRTQVEEGQVVLEIKDDGVGIPKKHLEKIFEPFWTTKGSHGGMGLAVSVGIIRRRRGSLTVTSKERKGTTFCVRLPLARKPLQKREAPVRQDVEPSLRILVIDDNEPDLREMEQGLKALGQTVFIAFTGEQGLSVFEDHEFDAIICDLGMPGLSGWNVSQEILNICVRKGLTKPPFVMLTAAEAPIPEDEILVHPDVDKIVLKPASATRLLEIIRKEVKGAVTQAAFSGSVYGIDLLEYLQLLLFTGQQVVLEIRSRDGERGLLYIDKGAFCHATCGELVGEDAFFRCLSFKGGSFSSLPWRDPEKISIEQAGEFLLFEAARRRDETGRDKSAAS